MNTQGSEGWFSDRLGKLTASRMSDVLAKGRGGAPSATRATYMAELAVERLTGQRYEGYESADMTRSKEMEAEARAAYESETGLLVVEVGCIDHPTISMAAASPDGLVGDGGLLEIKCPKSKTHIEYLLAGEPPPAYVPQMAWQLACTGRQWVDFASYDQRLPQSLRLLVVRYAPPVGYIGDLEREAIKFLRELDELVAKLKSRA